MRCLIATILLLASAAPGPVAGSAAEEIEACRKVFVSASATADDRSTAEQCLLRFASGEIDDPSTREASFILALAVSKADEDLSRRDIDTIQPVRHQRHVSTEIARQVLCDRRQ